MAALHALLLLSALPLAATIEVASSCASAGVPQAVQGSSLAFYVDTGVVGDVVFKQSTSTQLTVAGGCSLEFDAERQRNVLASTTCCEVGVPAGGDLDLFVNGDVRSVFLDTLSLGRAATRYRYSALTTPMSMQATCPSEPMAWRPWCAPPRSPSAT